MALTESNMMALNTKAPDFRLINTLDDTFYSLKDLASDQATVIIFSCNHCPYVIHINEKLVEISNKYQKLGVSFIAISSNDVEKYPQDAPDKMKALAEDVGYTFPYLYDEDQTVAKSYDAACTPDIYLFDGQLKLKYRGRFCASRPKSEIEVTGEDLTAAIDAVISKKDPDSRQYPSAGCNIKWK